MTVTELESLAELRAEISALQALLPNEQPVPDDAIVLNDALRERVEHLCVLAENLTEDERKRLANQRNVNDHEDVVAALHVFEVRFDEQRRVLEEMVAKLAMIERHEAQTDRTIEKLDQLEPEEPAPSPTKWDEEASHRRTMPFFQPHEMH